MNKALDEVRAGESRKLAQEGHEPLLRNLAGAVLKRKENLTAKTTAPAADLLRSTATVRAYLLKKTSAILDYNSPRWAGMFPGLLVLPNHAQRIEPMKKIRPHATRAPRTVAELFQGRKEFHSGVVEGLNNKAKVT